MLEDGVRSEAASFRQQLAEAHVTPLWEMFRTPPAAEVPRLWPWHVIEPLIEPAVRAAPVGDDRRVLILHSPDHLKPYVVRNLTAGVQILMPGENANVHRHSLGAIRFVMEGDGSATTYVNGKPCCMETGDLIITPPWAWHEHENTGDRRTVWFDALDVPLHEHFGTMALETGPIRDAPLVVADDNFGVAGFVPVLTDTLPEYSPLYRYPFSAAERALACLKPGADGTRLLRYTDPFHGGPVMPLIDCHLMSLSRVDSRPGRSNASIVCVVARGEGTSKIGETTLAWSQNDVFTIPSGFWARHRATVADAIIFMASDRMMLQRLGILKEEQNL